MQLLLRPAQGVYRGSEPGRVLVLPILTNVPICIGWRDLASNLQHECDTIR